MKNFSNQLSVRSFVCMAIFLFAVTGQFAGSVFAQEQSPDEIMKQAKDRQTKMMETQFLMMQLMQLGHNSELRKELEIVDDQVEAVKQLAKDYQEDMMNFHQKNRKLIAEAQKLIADGKHQEAKELSEKFQNKSTDLATEYMEKAGETLLPHQIERLSQISKQQRVKSMNQFSDEFGIPAALADEIGLSKEEKEKLIQTIKEARKKYYEGVETLKKEANEQIMSVLSSEQQEKMREILGDTYDQEKNRRRAMEEMRAKQRKQVEQMKDRASEMKKKKDAEEGDN